MREIAIFLLSALLSLGQAASALCVTSYQARLRTQPSSKARVSWVVGRYTPLVEVGRKGRWRKVKDLDGEIHWVSVSDVTSRVRCVAVNNRTATLRTGATTKSAPADLVKVDKYTAFKRIDSDESGDWYRVEDEVGGRYWISAGLVWRPAKVSQIGF